MKVKKGLLITIEGIEGSGKTTHSRLLYNFLKKHYNNVILISEPGGTDISTKIRKILLNVSNKKMFAETELLLFLASRAQLVREVIIPALRKKKIIICDRFIDSTFAYQVYGRNLSQKTVYLLNKFATDNLKPDITILLDENVKRGMGRIKNKDRMEREKITFHCKVRKGYLKLSKIESDRIKVIKTFGSVNETQQKVRETLLDVISNIK